MLMDMENAVTKLILVTRMSWKSYNITLEPHSYSALAFRIKGSGVIKVNGEEYFLKPNSVLYIPQNIGYSAEYTDTDILVFHFITMYDDPEPQCFLCSNAERLYKMFLEASDIWRLKQPNYMFKAFALLYSILGELTEIKSEVGLPEYFVKAVSIINSSYNTDITLSEICKRVGIGETAFRDLFKKHYLKTPKEYILDLKTDNAKFLILNGKSVKQAALESGFNDPKYFSRAFKKRCGITPSEFGASKKPYC